MSNKEMDDILGKAIDAVEADTNTEIQNDNDSGGLVQNDTDIEAGMDIDVLGDLLNESGKSDETVQEKKQESPPEESVDVLADLGIDLSDDEPYVNEGTGDTVDVESEFELDSDSKDDLDILDGGDVLVGDDDEESIDVADLIGQAKGESDTSSVTSPPSTVKEIFSEEEPHDADPLSDFGAEDPLDINFEEDDSLDDSVDDSVDEEESEDVIEPDFEDDTDLGDYESEEIVNIEPDIDDALFNDDALDDEDMIDISAEDVLVEGSETKSKFKPHTEVEDVEDMLTGDVGGMFAKETESSLQAETEEVEPIFVKKDLDDPVTESVIRVEKPEATNPTPEDKKTKVENAGRTFGAKAIVLSVVASSFISLGIGFGVFYAFGDKFMDKHAYIDSTALDEKMASVLADFEERLAAKADVQATKSDVDDQVSEVARNVTNMLEKYNSQITVLREKMDVLSQKQGVDKSELEDLSSQSIMLLTQFVDDVKEAQTKVSEEVYAKVIKTVRQEFSERDNTVKLDQLISEVSMLKDNDTKSESRLQTAMNLIGVLESDSDFMNRRLAAVEVGADPETKPAASQTLKKGYKDSEGENWAYLEIESKNGVKSGSHFRFNSSNKNAPEEANTLPYVLKGVFDTGTKDSPKYKVYVAPRASKNATPIGYSIGQQVPGMGRILNVEPTGGNEKIPYIVTTEIGVLKGEQ